jgi:PleD family two-component response regulator
LRGYRHQHRTGCYRGIQRQSTIAAGNDVGDQVLREVAQVSIGITLVRKSDSFLTTFKRADKVLYQAKINGKNQIIIC